VQPACDEDPFHVFVGDDNLATRQQGINADGNANFDGHAHLFGLNLHADHQPNLEHCKCFV
jgi:hypothetical protein